jgi:GNAT superfamily N-acetyltransferase
MTRPALNEDFKAVMGLYRQLNPEDPVVFDGSDRRTFERILADPALHILVLELDGEIVASTYLNIIPNLSRSIAPYAVVENVIVDSAHRGSGLGKQIMAASLQVAWDAGCYKAMLMTGSKRPSTLGFYRACGFDQDAKTAFLARPPAATS